MQRKNVIVIQEIWTHSPEIYGNLKKLCEEKKLPYHTLARLKFPISYKEFIIYRVPFK